MSWQFSEPRQSLQSRLSLPAGTIHLWPAELDRVDDEAPAFQVLSIDERHRALQFRFDRDRRRFTIARGTLRAVLAKYLACKANEITFSYGPYGKPEVECEGPQFNLSHSGDLAVIVVSAQAPLGVDVERVNRTMDSKALLSSFASARERDAFAALSQEDCTTAFFYWWTRKEAVQKALGIGHSLPMGSFDVSILPDDVSVTEVRSAEFCQCITLQNIPLAAGYIGSLAVCGSAHSIETRHVRPLTWMPGT
jgi:4'-phosphopantetheinyl transferase